MGVALTKLQIPGPYLEILICRNEVGLKNFLFFLLGALQGMWILVPLTRMELRLLAVEALSRRYWTARESQEFILKT